MCNGQQNKTDFTRGDIQKAFGLPSSEMTNGEFIRYSRELKAQQERAPIGETTKGAAWKQNSGSMPGLGCK